MPFVPDDFEAPDHVRTDAFELRLLTIADLAKDYEAYMTSIDHLQTVFDPSGAPWPTPDLDMRMALADLASCEWHHHCRDSFSYGAFTLDNRRELGCVYVNPTAKRGCDAQLVTWTRVSEHRRGFDDELFAFARDWVGREWPFERVVYPGRGDSWAECSSPPFVPADFVAPNDVAFGDYRLRLLTMNDLVLDYHAYMANVEHIRANRYFDHDWPHSGISLELALADLGMCEWQHAMRGSYSYGIFNPGHTEEIGCLYLLPGAGAGAVKVEFWLTEPYTKQGMETRLIEFARPWIEREWPLGRIRFSGID